MKVQFWGVRGSVPCASLSHMRYGGNTSCVTVEHNNEIVILDAGTGIVPLGKQLVRRHLHSATLLLSHAHLDHIFGLPFFAPAWMPDFKLKIMAGNLNNVEGGVRGVFDTVYSEPAFPVPVGAMRGVESFTDFTAGESFQAGIFGVKTMPLNHPNGATAYRVEFNNKSLCYVTDVEHEVGKIDPHIVEFIRGTDLFIYDTTYTEEEYKTKKGWGHSTWQHGIKLGMMGQVKRYALFHHEPDRTDDLMAMVEEEAKKEWNASFAAREGMEIEL
ncbi:MAG: MBL fold metallo-hydrolase [Candidatus Pacebacteria bacterium]|nr:MBL fold metallo-hydrolase [Candidatus Paceibacterota bacterium]